MFVDGYAMARAAVFERVFVRKFRCVLEPYILGQVILTVGPYKMACDLEWLENFAHQL